MVAVPESAMPPSAALAGGCEILPSDLPPDGTRNRQTCIDFPTDDLQAEVVIGWGLSAGLDTAFDDG
jgi:hypothetical protein